jgi:voltage-gated potassium channel
LQLAIAICEIKKEDLVMRKKIFEIIEISDGKNKLSSIYDCFMIVVIVASLVPLAFKETLPAFEIIDWICVGIFVVDYILRWITADYKYDKKGVVSFIRYPFGFMDLISILPSFTALNASFKVLRLFRMLRAFRVFRALKAFRYSKSMHIITNVLKRSKASLTAVGTFAMGYVLVAALVIFNVEPDSFATFFDAIYWATISLTTVGYGDIYPVTVAGRLVTMVSSVLGIAIIALPSGIITAGYMKEVSEPSGISVDKNGDTTDENN